MALITSIKDLEKYTLNYDDHVVFFIDNDVLEYEVVGDHLMGIKIPNNKIFDKLGFLSFDERHNYASSIYGYCSDTGSWPSSREGDYVGLTKLVKSLYELIDKKKKRLFDPSENTKIDPSQDSYVGSKVITPKIKIKYIKSDINSKLKLIK